jgi:hypothetical protein
LNTTNTKNKSTPKKSKSKKKSDDEDASEDETPKKKKKATTKKVEDKGEREVHVFPNEKLQINQVKWNPRAVGNKWVAFGGNCGLLCIKLAPNIPDK